MAVHESVKTTLDLTVFGTAITINVSDLNEYVSLAAGVLAISWSVIRFIEWAKNKQWRKRRPT